jgi:Na+/melibiose symporter-like transporter
MLKRLSPLDLFLAVFILMYYGRLSVVMFVPQYVIGYGIPATYLSMYFAMISVGCAISNVIAIVLLRHISPKKMFLLISAVSAAYEVLLYLYPTPESLVLSGLLIGLGQRARSGVSLSWSCASSSTPTSCPLRMHSLAITWFPSSWRR